MSTNPDVMSDDPISNDEVLSNESPKLKLLKAVKTGQTTTTTTMTSLTDPNKDPNEASYTLRCLQSVPLPSPSTCFNSLRVCKANLNKPIVCLGTVKRGEVHVVKGKKRPFKVKRDKQVKQLEQLKGQGENGAGDDKDKDDDRDKEAENVVATDVIGGDKEDWDDWSEHPSGE